MWIFSIMIVRRIYCTLHHICVNYVGNYFIHDVNLIWKFNFPINLQINIYNNLFLLSKYTNFYYTFNFLARNLNKLSIISIVSEAKKKIRTKNMLLFLELLL